MSPDNGRAGWEAQQWLDEYRAWSEFYDLGRTESLEQILGNKFGGHMSLKAKDPGGGDFVPAPEGTHIARCYRVIDVGTQHNQRFDTKSQKVLVNWELPEEKTDEGEPFSIGQLYTNSLHEKAKLRQHLEAWRAKAFTGGELEGFDLRNILDKYCLLSIVHAHKDGKTYANINSVMALPKSTDKPKGINETVWFDLDEFLAGGCQETFEGFSEGLQKLIKQSEEYQGRLSEKHSDPDPEWIEEGSEARF